MTFRKMINMGKEMEELLKNISSNDLEKLKLLLSFIPGNEPIEVVTLRVFVEEYSDFIKLNRSKAYYDSVVYSLKHLTDFFGSHKSIQSLGLRNIETFTTHLQQKVTKGYRVYHRTLKAAFNKATEWGYVKENYFLKVKLPKKQKLAPVFINSDQLSAISNQIINKTVKDVVVFAFYTGMRLDEIVNLRWKNVDFGNRVITVGDDNFTTKGRNQRFIPICEEVFAILLALKKTPSFIHPLSKGENISGFVFCKPDGKKYTGDHISQSFKRACNTAGLDNAIHFHSLRHSFASNLVQKGVPLYTIKELLGHSSISTTEIYSHLNMETLQKAIKTFDEPNGYIPAPTEPPPESNSGQALSRREFNEVKIFRINTGE
jgi:site-specific recombinase XerD